VDQLHIISLTTCTRLGGIDHIGFYWSWPFCAGFTTLQIPSWGTQP